MANVIASSSSPSSTLTGLTNVQPLVHLSGLSIEDYFKKLEEMIIGLRQHWNLENRVTALKVAIQLTKLLADTSQIKLYSKRYKMIVDLLDEFGLLVYHRIHYLAKVHKLMDYSDNEFNGNYNTTSEKIKPEHRDQASINIEEVNLADERAKDTCRNWFLKIASIRELVPRFFMELSILKTCDILLKNSIHINETRTDQQLYSQSLRRLSKAAWGFGDPIVAVHARAYLCRSADLIIHWNKKDTGQGSLFELVRVNLKASITTVSRLDSGTVTRALETQNVDIWIFFELLSNALQAISNTVTYKDDLYTNEDKLSDRANELFEILFLDSFEAITQNGCCSLLAKNIILHSTIRAMPPSIIAKHCSDIVNLINSSYETWIDCREVPEEIQPIFPTLYPTLESLATALDAYSVDTEIDNKNCKFANTEILSRIQIILNDLINEDMKKISSLRPQYLRCFKAWLSCACHYLDPTELDKFLNEFIIRIKENHQYINHYATIIELIKVLISGNKTTVEFKRVFAMKSFKRLLELLRRDDHKLEASRLILDTMRIELKLGRSNQSRDSAVISDRRMINFMLGIFSNINDSLGLLVDPEDIEQLSQLITLFIEMVFVSDYFERLEFLSKCRSSLNNLAPILNYLAEEALKLAIEYRKIERRRNSRRNYLNGCLAFALVTIPAFDNPITRLDLLIKGSSLALEYISLSLGDFYIKQLLASLRDLIELSQYNFEAEKVTTSLLRTISSIKSSEGLIRKHLLELTNSILELFKKYHDHIDLRHKLLLLDLIENSFNDDPNLILKSEFLRIIDQDDCDNGTLEPFNT